MEKPLHIPKGKGYKTLRVFCYKCDTLVYDNCKLTGQEIGKCKYGDSHRFKIIVPIPGEKYARKTRTLKTTDLKEAILEAVLYEKEINESIHSTPTAEVSEIKNKQKNNIPYLLVEALARDIGRLNNEGVPQHRIEERSIEHIKDVERAFKVIMECLRKNGYNLSLLRLDEITDWEMGLIHKYLVNVKKFKGRTLNKYFSHYTSFLTRHNQEYNTGIQNLFETVPRKKIIPKPEVIYSDEYQNLLKIITPENGEVCYEGHIKTKRNYYFHYLSHGIQLGIETGRRRNEICNMRFNNIIIDRNGFAYIKIEDAKVNQIQGRTTEAEKKYVLIPVTNSLQKLLNELEYEKYKGTDHFILEPEITRNRIRNMSDNLSRGFSHFYKKLKTSRQLSFKALRKTYITNLSLYMGGNAKAITGHSDDAVIEQFYLNKEAVAKAALGFEVFSSEISRKNELDQLRSKINEHQIKLEI